MLTFTNGKNHILMLKSSVSHESQKSQEVNNEELRDNLLKGKYDQLIFGEHPKLTEDLKTLIKNHNREFVQHLFMKCDSRDTLNFWFQDGGVKFPKDALALAVNLGCNIYALQYLKDAGYLDDLSKEDKVGLIKRAQRFEGKGFEYLKAELSNETPKLKI